MRALLLLVACVFSLRAADTVKTVCSSGGDYDLAHLQAAVDDAMPSGGNNWIISICAGQTADSIAGVRLTDKSLGNCTGGKVMIISSGYWTLPADTRVTPATSGLATIQGTLAPYEVVYGYQKSSCYYFGGIRFKPVPGSPGRNMVWISGDSVGIPDHAITDLPDWYNFDKCTWEGVATVENGPQRALLFNGRHLSVTNSYFSEIKFDDGEAQAIACWQCVGPFYLRNNHLESSTMITLFGGAVGNIPGARAEHVLIIGNHYYKPWTYRVQTDTVDPSGTCMWDARGGEYWHNTSGATYWQCVSGTWTTISAGAFPYLWWAKNIAECKNSNDLTWIGNTMEHAWLPTAQQQHGAAWLLNIVDNDPNQWSGPYAGGERTAVCQDVRIHYNRVIQTPWMVAEGLLGRAPLEYNYLANQISIRHNLATGLGDEPYSLGDSKVLQTNAFTRVSFLNNTIITNGIVGSSKYFMGLDSYGFTFPTVMANISGANECAGKNAYYSFSCSATAYDDTNANPLVTPFTMKAWPPPRAFARNVIVNNKGCDDIACTSPATNLSIACPTCATPAAYTDVGFTSFGGADFSLAASSPYIHYGEFGQPAGADTVRVLALTAHNVDGAANPCLNFQERGPFTVTSTSVTMQWLAPTTTATTASIGTSWNGTDVLNASSDGGGSDLGRSKTQGSLTADTRYFYTITDPVCGPIRGYFLTLR